MADGTNQIIRALPHNIEAEQALLGAILLDNRAMERVVDLIDKDDFYDPLHGLVFKLCGDMIAAGRTANPITLRPLFEAAEGVGGITVPVYLGRLFKDAASLLSAIDYARAIKDLATRRKLIAVARQIESLAQDSPLGFPPARQIAEAESALYELTDKRRGSSQAEMPDAIKQTLKSINDAMMRGGGLAGLSTGYPSLDRMIGGMGPGNLIVLGAASSMGKSALAINIAENVASGSDPAHVAIFSQEMSVTEITTRIIARNSGIPTDMLRRGMIDEREYKAISAGASGLKSSPITQVTESGLTLSRLASRARRIVRSNNTKLIMIDYLQLMQGEGSFVSSRNLQIGEITTGLKALGGELQLPIILLSQINREAPKRENKRPQLSDLRDSGQIEQDADVVMFVHRQDYYLERSQPDPGDGEAMMKWQIEMDACRGKAEVIVAKNRQGKTGIVGMNYDGPRTTFSEMGA